MEDIFILFLLKLRWAQTCFLTSLAERKLDAVASPEELSAPENAWAIVMKDEKDQQHLHPVQDNHSMFFKRHQTYGQTRDIRYRIWWNTPKLVPWWIKLVVPCSDSDFMSACQAFEPAGHNYVCVTRKKAPLALNTIEFTIQVQTIWTSR